MIESEKIIERELREKGSVAVCTSGYSMMPMLGNRRDMVVLETPSRELKKYDVALYKSDSGQYILHRIIKVKSEEYIARGDNNYFKERVPKDSVLAILTRFNRKGKSYKSNTFSYKCYSRVRVWSYPVRRACRSIRALLSRVYHKIFRKSK